MMSLLVPRGVRAPSHVRPPRLAAAFLATVGARAPQLARRAAKLEVRAGRIRRKPSEEHPPESEWFDVEKDLEGLKQIFLTNPLNALWALYLFKDSASLSDRHFEGDVDLHPAGLGVAKPWLGRCGHLWPLLLSHRAAGEALG